MIQCAENFLQTSGCLTGDIQKLSRGAAAIVSIWPLFSFSRGKWFIGFWGVSVRREAVQSSHFKDEQTRDFPRLPSQFAGLITHVYLSGGKKMEINYLEDTWVPTDYSKSLNTVRVFRFSVSNGGNFITKFPFLWNYQYFLTVSVLPGTWSITSMYECHCTRWMNFLSVHASPSGRLGPHSSVSIQVLLYALCSSQILPLLHRVWFNVQLL